MLQPGQLELKGDRRVGLRAAEGTLTENYS